MGNKLPKRKKKVAQPKSEWTLTLYGKFDDDEAFELYKRKGDVADNPSSVDIKISVDKVWTIGHNGKFFTLWAKKEQ